MISIADRDRLLDTYRYLCARGARKFLRPGLERCDLEQVAAIGLLKACDRYDPALETPFEAYAWLFVVGELMHHVRDYERLVRAPRKLRGMEKKWMHACERLTMTLGRAPRNAEVARELGTDEATLSELQRCAAAATSEPLENAVGRGGHVAQGEVDELLDRLCVESALEALNEMERDVIVGVYSQGTSQLELAARMGSSRRHISRLHRSALDKMLARIAPSGGASLRGFTLIELMIVVAIIAILAGILIPNFTHARAQAQTAACEANLREIATALELYFADNQSYPGGSGGAITAATIASGGVSYLSSVPQDPAASPITRPYTYLSTASANPPSYTITCPGAHNPGTLAKIAGGVTTNTKLTYTSSAGLGTAP
ncbi:MAG: hypothetical protein NVS1B14_08340 [Vulcanimicrobiaceae bacterium]